ncbi:DNA-directed RNA polymerase III subunit RPC7 [Histoplasma capsulatum]|uniref:DNA-directed RNA polymerase III subunit RPC7 n=1 Tax=Ajellomyces capsulatus TaxID=5037 RepID=A0A8A1MIW3_AJECA|nr:conserved hypothetical protein [Histoplasma mississippiense (nom. inval.)]EDN06325.1 conserved hypothetical protein [Histoplasma mississippiense (nom. inval.)]QSS65849.1 DNA-directed RNA polymerase III subunit RPC7 [Histoplasma capsulatum]
MEVPSSFNVVKNHLDQVIQDPSTPLDVTTLDKLKIELIANTSQNVLSTILTQVSQVLPILHEDPSPLVELATTAVSYLSFTQLQSIRPPLNLLAGIKAPSPPINLLTLSLLRKGSNSSGDAAIISGNPALVIALVELWLTVSETAVSQSAFDVLWALLEADYVHDYESDVFADREKKNKIGGRGLMWRRMFNDRDVYERLFSICSLDNSEPPGHISRRDKSVAQSRLMDLITKAGSMDWHAIAASHFPDIESKFGCSSLLSFAASQMVDPNDVLLHMTHIHFLRELLRIEAPGLRQRSKVQSHSYPPFSSPSLEYLISSGLHAKIMNYYVDPSILDPAYSPILLGPVMGYISQYAILYPNHLLQQPQSFLDKILSRISEAFDIQPIKWAHGPVPTGDLDILASLPRVMLVEAGNRWINPVQSIPSKPINSHALDALGRIFKGPPAIEDVSNELLDPLDQSSTSPRAEAAASRVLYFRYLNENPGLWANVVAAADIVAMQDTALAAIAFIKSVLTANWVVIPPNKNSSITLPNQRFGIPTEDQISKLGPSTQGKLPASGLWALFVPPALTEVLPYLFKAPQTYNNFVAGGARDTENALWRIATAKFDALVALQNEVKKVEETFEGFDDIIRTLNKRVAEGPWGAPNQVGGQVDALEL